MVKRGEAPGKSPDWDALFGVAQAQAGYFTTRQAARAGYSPQLLAYLGDKKVLRVRRGIYRLVHFPSSDQEDLVVGRAEGALDEAAQFRRHRRLDFEADDVLVAVDVEL